MTGTYRRAEEGDYRCSEDEVRRMLADQSDTPADSQILEHFGQPDFDPETMKQFRNRFASRAQITLGCYWTMLLCSPS
jgi:ATP-dependent DNA helicase RecG